LQDRSVSIGNGSLTRFWLDPWVHKEPLSLSAPVLFELCENKNIIVAQVLNGLQIIFRRWLFDDLRANWNNILQDTMNFQLIDRDDTILWVLGKKGRFTVESVYVALTSSSAGIYHKRIWKGKIPEKIKIFLWLMANDAILTKDNLSKTNWQGDPSCVFCDSVETISHLFSNVLLLRSFGW